MGLGTYPEVSLVSAREKAFAARQLIASGSDPLEVRRVEQHTSQILLAPTFEKAARAVLEEIEGGFRNAKHKDQWISTLQTYAFPVIGEKRVNDLRASDFADVLRPIWLTKPETASRVRQRCDTIFELVRGPRLHQCKSGWRRFKAAGAPIRQEGTRHPSSGGAVA